MTDTIFNKEQVFEILSSPVGGSELARRFNVSPSTISSIRVGRLYAKFYNEFSEANKCRNMPPAIPIKRDRLYTIFYKMHERCDKNNERTRKWYFDKGITVCDEWAEYPSFKSWALASGYRKNLTIDRRENDKGYSPENCRWITIQEQQYNKDSSAFVTIGGVKKTIAEWVKGTNVNEATVRDRIRRGWPHEEALLSPANKGKHKWSKKGGVANCVKCGLIKKFSRQPIYSFTGTDFKRIAPKCK